MRLSAKAFKQLIEQALAGIPAELAGYLDNVVIDVEPMPDAQTLQSVGVTDPTELMGLYQGTPLTERGLEESARLPDRIVIYQGNVESEARTRQEIIDQVRTTVLHEIGHHFGLSEEDLDELGYD